MPIGLQTATNRIPISLFLNSNSFRGGILFFYLNMMDSIHPCCNNDFVGLIARALGDNQELKLAKLLSWIGIFDMEGLAAFPLCGNKNDLKTFLRVLFNEGSLPIPASADAVLVAHGRVGRFCTVEASTPRPPPAPSRRLPLFVGYVRLPPGVQPSFRFQALGCGVFPPERRCARGRIGGTQTPFSRNVPFVHFTFWRSRQFPPGGY